MKTSNELFDLVKQSNMTLIGYTFKDERIKDELISNFNYIEIEKIDSSFSFKSFLRDLKLNSILENSESTKKPEYILVDVNNIFCNSEDMIRQKIYSTTIERIRQDMYSFTEYKLIVTCPLYKGGVNSEGGDIKNFIGGSKPLHLANLAMFVYSDKVKVIKSRNVCEEDYILKNTKQSIEI